VNDQIDVDRLNSINIVDVAERLGLGPRPRGGTANWTTERHDSLILFTRTNTWRQFSADQGGDVIALVQRFGPKDFKDACAFLTGLNGAPIVTASRKPEPPAPQPELPQDEHLRYHRAMRPADRGWWMEHYGISEDAMNRFYLGVCREGRFAPITYTIPVFQGSRLVNIKHRIPDAPHGSKYRNHQAGVGTQLFNADRATPDCKGVVIVAGEMKAIVLEDFGIPAVSPTGGCGSWKDEWTALLGQCQRLYVAYDPEPPDERKHALALMEKLGPGARFVDCPLKPDDYILANGEQAFRDLLRQARTLGEVRAWDAALAKARRTVRV